MELTVFKAYISLRVLCSTHFTVPTAPSPRVFLMRYAVMSRKVGLIWLLPVEEPALLVDWKRFVLVTLVAGWFLTVFFLAGIASEASLTNFNASTSTESAS